MADTRGGGLITACTQPGCTGRIVDGYCDVCGSPAGAAPFVPARAAASAASPAPAVEAGLTAVGRVSGVPLRPNNPLTLACTQQGCTGTIVDGYCDVCGSPAGAVPFVPPAASAASPAPDDEPGLTAVPASTPPAAPVNEEIPTWRVPPVKMPRKQLSTQEMTGPGAADPGAVDAKQVDREKVGPADGDTGKVDGGKELAEEDPGGAQVYRRRIAEAQLPHDVYQAALCEVGKLERTSDQSPESADIRTWLDTILDLPWSTKSTDWIDIQESREVEATLRRLIEPAVADTAEVASAVADLVEGDTAEVAPTVADLVEGDTAEVAPTVADLVAGDTAEVAPAVADVEETESAPAGPHDDDTVQMPAVVVVLGAGRQPLPQLTEQQVLGPVPVQNPAHKKRFGSLVLAAAILAALLIGALFFANRDVGGVTAQSVTTVTATATMPVSKSPSERSDESTDTVRGAETIQLEDLADSARPFEAVRIQGTHRGGAGSFLRVQRWEGGKWVDFPLPTKTDQSGQFATYVEFGQPGRYQLRVLDPDSRVTSETFVLLIKG
jgi:hypothetical protein